VRISICHLSFNKESGKPGHSCFANFSEPFPCCFSAWCVVSLSLQRVTIVLSRFHRRFLVKPNGSQRQVRSASRRILKLHTARVFAT